jgi:hypothetical protein
MLKIDHCFGEEILSILNCTAEGAVHIPTFHTLSFYIFILFYCLIKGQDWTWENVNGRGSALIALGVGQVCKVWFDILLNITLKF